MQTKKFVLCGNVSAEGISADQKDDIRLRLSGVQGEGNITLRVEDIHSKMFSSVPTKFHDLLEIATYVYSADQMIVRGADDVDNFGDGWRRDLHFVVPVRNPDFWNSAEMKDALASTLGFLSDDNYEFSFVKLEQDHSIQEYLEFNDAQAIYGKPEQVVMFSGGLDSLAGALDEVLSQKKRVVLVTHKATPKLNNRHKTLRDLLAQKAGDNAPHQISVRVHKRKPMNREYTQRSRSFLFVSIGATIAKMLDLNSVRFYENGVISLNLPVCAQVVGGRATRTTHPKVMKGFQDIITLVAEAPFTVENPYIWKTKAEVVEQIVKVGCADLIKHSMTCTHTWEMTNQHTHCGLCSQCIDRRFAVIAAKADQYDPIDHYKADVFTQSRNKDDDKIMSASYLERANQVSSLENEVQFLAKFAEVNRVLRFLGGSTAQAAQRVFDLYKRHAGEVNAALDEMVRRHATAIRTRTMPGDALLRAVHESASVISVPAVSWKEKQPENLFRKRGGGWEARFNRGNTINIIGVDKGAEYINLLLAHPDRETSVYEIVCGYALSVADAANSGLDHDDIEEGFQVTTGAPLGDAGVVVDSKAVEQYQARYKLLCTEKAEAEADGDHQRVEEIEDELAQIFSAITGGTAKGGKLRKAGDKRKNVRDAFRNSVNRAITAIGKYDKPLAEHLKASIKHGNEVVYRPETPITWDVRPIVNG